ncbi:hypothetical protein C4J81_13845 [Deltaproteobacteria bacterium Smac51]|nr:hypothetical protein C4J81_13845 [Deltaproteobacteria bacterium Smac51]
MNPRRCILESLRIVIISPTVREVDTAAVRPWWPSSFGRPLDRLADSIKSLGLIRPLIVLADGAAFKLVCGRLRLAVLAGLERGTVPARVLPPETSAAQALEIALADNYERGWNQAELALLWKFLSENLPGEEALRLSSYLDLAKSPKIRAWALAAAGLPEKGLTALADGGLDLESAARLAVWEPESRGALLDIFEALAPSKQKKRQWLDWLEDIARREKVSPADVLKSKEIQAALADGGGSGKSAAEDAARHYLWRRRHPQLSELTAGRREQVKALGLPKNLKLEADPTFEDLKFSLSMTFASHDELEALGRKVAGLADDPAMIAMLKEGSQ